MKKIKRRAYSALLVALCLIVGMTVYVCRFAAHGQQWVRFSANQAVFHGGRLLTGTVTDRNGLILADAEDGTRSFADDPVVRTAVLHAVGDREGNIGTGALTAFSDRLTGYSAVTGLAEDGAVLTLSLDAELCCVAYDALAGRRGAVLVSDYTTGEIRCMTSSPSYDPDEGFDESDVRYDGVYLNRCLSAAYPPGSIFKLATLTAAMENIPDLSERRFTCGGSVTVDGNEIHCTGVHGEQTVEQALANSCNCAFAELSLELGGKTMKQYADRLGLTGQLTLDGVYTAAGRFDAAESGSAALAWSGIGQSTDLVTPFAMLRCVSAIANGGVLVPPTLLCGEASKPEKLLDAKTAGQLKAMMNYNVAYSYGTWNFPGLALCAKSGTAEVGDGTSHAWFTGFLDDPEHPYAFVVLIENAGGGARNAGPVANTVLQAAIQNETK